MSITLREAGNAQYKRPDLAPSIQLDRAAVESGRASAVPRILMLCTLYKMPYRVMRCAAAAGANVYALGSPASRSLTHSRFCRGFKATDILIDGVAREELLGEINQCVATWEVDIVLAGDAPATRTLIALRDRIHAPCFPMPDLESFDRLNDKWRFYHLCLATGVRTPDTWLFRDATKLRDALDAGSLPRKVMAKPLSQSGGEGCLVVDTDAKTTLRRIDYSPILVQQFVEGEDIGASIFCKRGVVKAFVAHSFRRDTYRTFADARIRSDIEKLLRMFDVDGVFNFDMRRDPDGHVHYLECNPRFFFKIAMSMLAGINFVELGLEGVPEQAVVVPDRTVRFPKALMCMLWAIWRIEPESWRALGFTLSDPMPYFREEVGFEG